MAMCEIADEDLLGIPARANDSDTKEFEEFGYYIDDKGIKRFGTIPKAKQDITKNILDSQKNNFRWVDMNGLPRFDDKFDVLDARDLKKIEY